MSDAATGGSVAQAIHTNPLVESILNLQFPSKRIWEQMQIGFAAAKPCAEVPELQKVKQRRAELQALSSDELRRLHAQLVAEQSRQEAAREAAAEAARFYNQPQAQANFAFWLKVDFWTFDDAIALLLGKNPQVVTWAAVDQAVKPKGFFRGAPVRSKFLSEYMMVRDLALRSDVMTRGPKLRPEDVVTWAMRRVDLKLPEPLRALASVGEAQQPKPPSQEDSGPPQIATSAGGVVAKPVIYSTRALRRDDLTAVIEQAQGECTNPFDVASVWARLQVMAEKKVPPLIGSTEEGLQYLDQGEAAVLNRKALWKRLARAKDRA